MLLRLLPLLCLLFLSQASPSQSGTANQPKVPDNCPVTKPEDQPFVPPPPYLAKAPTPETFWYGTDEVVDTSPCRWDMGGVAALHPERPNIQAKTVLLAEGYNWRAEPKPLLTITGWTWMHPPRRSCLTAPTTATARIGSHSW